MKREYKYERREAASRMEAVMVAASFVSFVAAVFAFLGYGWLGAVLFLTLGAIAFALSRVLELLGDFVCVV